MTGHWMRTLGRLNPSCREAMGLFSRSLDGPPSRADRVILAIHLLHCPACRRSRRQVLLLVSALRSLSSGSSRALPGLPEPVRLRIKRAIRPE